MTFLPTKSTTARSGLSVIEVLTSMVVALIGVAGVMILIPFAIRQAELGLDIDDANRLARNAVSQFEIGEHNRLIGGLSVWILDSAGTRVGAPEAVAIDPMMIVMDGSAPLANALEFDQFPPSRSIDNAGFDWDTGIPDHFPQIANVNLAHHDATATPATFTAFNEASARRMFLTADDLQFEEPADDLTGPTQVYDVDSGGANVRRQSRGEMSWMSIVNPVKDDYVSVAPTTGTGAWKFQQQILVFKNRVFSDTAMIMPIAQVKVDPSATDAPDVVFSGGTITVLAEVRGVRKNDWIMLVNEDPRLEAGFQKQIAFYRVIGYGAYGLTGPNETQITLDGPDFNLRNENTRTTAPGTDPDTDIVNTYAVHLVNFDQLAYAAGKFERAGYVVNVYERTFRLDEKSIWNK